MFSKKQNIVLFLLAVNVLVSITAAYFPEGVLHTGLIRAALMVAIIPFLLVSGIRLTQSGLLIVICVSYLLLLVPFSSSPMKSLDVVVKVAISLVMFILAYNYLRGDEARRKLAILIPVFLGLFVANFFVAQVFGLGRSYYVDEGLRTGGGGVHQTYLIAYFALFLPLIGFFRDTPFRLNWWEVALLLLALFPLVLIGRRGAILGFGIGLVLYLIITPRKGRMLGIAGLAVVVAVLASPLYLAQFEGMVEHRTQRIESPEDVGRVQELFLATNMLWDEGIRHALFGSELFNYTEISGGDRPLHTDYATYLIGAGAIGFSLYFGIVVFVALDFLRRLPLVKDPCIRREFAAVIGALLAAYAVISFSGQYYVISSLVVVFAMFGAILARLEDYAVSSRNVPRSPGGKDATLTHMEAEREEVSSAR